MTRWIDCLLLALLNFLLMDFVFIFLLLKKDKLLFFIIFLVYYSRVDIIDKIYCVAFFAILLLFREFFDFSWVFFFTLGYTCVCFFLLLALTTFFIKYVLIIYVFSFFLCFKHYYYPFFAYYCVIKLYYY